MGENTKIEWADHTFNPWIGCQKVSQECKFCYAENWAIRYRNNETLWGDKDATRHRTSSGNWKMPLKWNRDAMEAKQIRTVFCASLADWAEERPELDPYRQELFQLIRQTPNLIWLLLTKRPDNVLKIYEDLGPFPPNVWIGFSAGTLISLDRATTAMQKLTSWRIPFFLSCEPLLEDIGPLLRIVLSEVFTPMKPSWIIVGGESGKDKNIRPMNPQWATRVGGLANRYEIPFMFKQWGEWSPGSHEEYEQSSPTRAGFFDPNVADFFLKGDGKPFGFVLTDAMQVMIRRGKHESGRDLCGLENNGNPFSKYKKQTNG